MEAIDTLGIKNYTFKILNHPEDNYKTFHNLVLTEKENSLEVTVLKYEMSDFFAQQFDNAPETFINFEGTITSGCEKNRFFPRLSIFTKRYLCFKPI